MVPTTAPANAVNDESRDLADMVNREVLPIDSFETATAPVSPEVENVIGAMRKFVGNLGGR